jgi:hypothetical protein
VSGVPHRRQVTEVLALKQFGCLLLNEWGIRGATKEHEFVDVEFRRGLGRRKRTVDLSRDDCNEINCSKLSRGEISCHHQWRKVCDDVCLLRARTSATFSD